MISLPARAYGIASAWIDEGRLKPRDSQDAHNSGMIPNSEKVLSEEVGASGAGEGEGERDLEAELRDFELDAWARSFVLSRGGGEDDAERDDPAEDVLPASDMV
jgi:hypothetical protein